MKKLLGLILAVLLVWWLSTNTFTLPGVGLVHLSWPAAFIGVAMLYIVFGLLPWLMRSEH
jgi:hypothetical protein